MTHRLTSSCAQLLMRDTPAAWAQLAKFLEAERNWSDVPHENMPAPLRWGLEQEPEARWLFAEAHPEVVCREKCFLVFHDAASPLAPYVGTSPDVAVYADGKLMTVVEVKCPYTDTSADLARKYRAQIQWHLFVSGVAFCVLVIFDPRVPRYVEIPIARDEPYIAQMEAKAIRFVESYITGEPLCAST